MLPGSFGSLTRHGLLQHPNVFLNSKLFSRAVSLMCLYIYICLQVYVNRYIRIYIYIYIYTCVDVHTSGRLVRHSVFLQA